jgi:hypothetical protein
MATQAEGGGEGEGEGERNRGIEESRNGRGHRCPMAARYVTVVPSRSQQRKVGGWEDEEKDVGVLYCTVRTEDDDGRERR